MTFCQRLTASNQKEQSLYWCSLSSSDILSTFDSPKSDSPKSKGTELVLVISSSDILTAPNQKEQSSCSDILSTFDSPKSKGTRACIGVLYLAVTFCQRLTSCPNQKEQSLYWCSLSCSDILSTFDSSNQKEQSLYWCSLSCSDILSTFDSLKSKGKELVLVFRACIGVLYLAVTFCQRLTAPNQKEQSLYWCSLSCSDILSTFDSPKSKGQPLSCKSKGTELVLVFFILQ